MRLGNAMAARRRPVRPRGLPRDVKDLRIALIADTFTFEGLSRECKVFPLTPADWQSELRSSNSHMLLVESCWHGREGEWQGLVQTNSAVLRRVVSAARKIGIPTVFWAKEDPVHWNDFLATARLFDHVFSTDRDCIPRYIAALGHDRVHLLTFAIQPRLHHPIVPAHRVRKAGSFFAGAWYQNFPDRCRQFQELAGGVMRAGPFHVYRRQVPAGQVQDFPSEYAQVLRPGIPYVELGDLYRSYEVGLTINTVTTSSTMFARRAVELMACGTRVFSNRCRALEELFGDLVHCLEGAEDARETADRLFKATNSELNRQWRVRAIRAAHSKHDWHSRIIDLVAAMAPTSAAAMRRRPKIIVISSVASASELSRLLSAINGQEGVDVECRVRQAQPLALPPRVYAIDGQDHARPPSELFGRESLIAPFHPDDSYGSRYLFDLVLGMRFGLGAVVGKACYQVAESDGSGRLVSPELEYRLVHSIALRRSLFSAHAWTGSLADVLNGLEAGQHVAPGLVSMDGFSYVERGALR